VSNYSFDRKKNHFVDEKIGRCFFDIKNQALVIWQDYDGQQSRSYGRLLKAFGNIRPQSIPTTSSMLHGIRRF